MIGDVLGAAAVLLLLSVPLGLSVWALLDVARRPRWVWAFSGRRQVVWLGVIAIGVTTLVGGIVISLWYLVRVRPGLAAIEGGQVA